jgi:hypothetical protein
MNGQVLNDKGNVVGTVEVVPGAAALRAARAPHNSTPDPIKELEGLRVSRDGTIKNKQNVVVGGVRRSEINNCHGRYVSAHGEIRDRQGTVLAVATLGNPGTEPTTAMQPPRDEPRSQWRAGTSVSLETIADAKIDNHGYVSFDGRRVAKVVEGTVEKLRLRHIDRHGRVYNTKRQYLGRVQLLENQPTELSRDDIAMRKGPASYDEADVSPPAHT